MSSQTSKMSNREMQKYLNSKRSKLRKTADSDDSDNDGYETIGSEDSYSDDTSDSSYVPPKKKQKQSTHSKKNNKKGKGGKHKVVEYDDDDDDDDIDITAVRNLITKLFPSKYMKERNENTKSNRKMLSSKSNKKYKKKISKRASKYEDDDEDDDEEDEEDDEDDEDDGEVEEDEEDEEETEYEEDDDEQEQGVYNIVLALDGMGDEEAEEYIEDNAECDSDDEEAFMKETYQPDIIHGAPDKSVKRNGKKNNKKNKNNADNEDDVITDVEQEYLDLVQTKKQLSLQLTRQPNSKFLKKAVADCKKSINKLIKRARSKNAKSYHKLIHTTKKKTNEIEYFKKKMSNKEQLRAMNDLKEINKHINIDKPYRLALLDSDMPAKFKASAMQRLNVLRTMEPGESEYYKIKNWVDTFMRIPFGTYQNLDVQMSDGLDTCHNFMANAKNTLDNCVYGLNDAKMQIMQMMGQWISNPSAMGTAIAIKGPMGTGKTTLVKEGISKILGREFAFIALGGTGDSSFLEGHSYAYEGSSWGKIVQILIDSKCMNPVIYFDELDKISDTPRGEEIIGILTHLTDTSQNSQFHDKYFSEVDFDLSKCLFIFSYNDESKVNPILRDRMYRIQTKGYDSKEKIVIARKHLLPSIREQVNFTEEDIIIPDETLQHIISSQDMTKKEDGVRNLKRCLEIIYTKLNLFRLVKPEEKIFDKELDIGVSFPFTVTSKHVDTFIKSEDKTSQSMLAMYV